MSKVVKSNSLISQSLHNLCSWSFHLTFLDQRSVPQQSGENCIEQHSFMGVFVPEYLQQFALSNRPWDSEDIPHFCCCSLKQPIFSELHLYHLWLISLTHWCHHSNMLNWWQSCRSTLSWSDIQTHASIKLCEPYLTVKCDIVPHDWKVSLSCPSMWSSEVSDDRKKLLKWHWTKSSHSVRSAHITRDAMARYSRPICSHVCSSHTTQLMDRLIFGAAGNIRSELEEWLCV